MDIIDVHGAMRCDVMRCRVEKKGKCSGKEEEGNRKREKKLCLNKNKSECICIIDVEHESCAKHTRMQ